MYNYIDWSLDFMKNRSELRDIIVKSLYKIYIYNGVNIDYNVNDVIKETFEENINNNFVYDVIDGILKNEEEILHIANKHLKDWDIERLSKVDKAIMSLAIYELLFTDTPNIVCINEAIDLSKKYSDEKVTKMINATLDSIYHNECGEE